VVQVVVLVVQVVVLVVQVVVLVVLVAREVLVVLVLEVPVVDEVHDGVEVQ